MALNGRKIIKLSVFVAGFSGIVMEYIVSTVASYLLGDTIFQWAVIISLFLFSMGMGSRLTSYIPDNEETFFVFLECLLAFVMAISIPLAYGMMSNLLAVSLILYGSAVIMGILIGMEIPLIIRINSSFEHLSSNLGSVLEKDYIGALVGGLFFAFVGLSKIGSVQLAPLLGALNWLMALTFFISFRPRIKKHFVFSAVVSGMVVFSMIPFASAVAEWGEERKYKDEIIYSRQSNYQKIVMTKWRNFFWLYIDGNIQFSSFDEYRYHESLVHPAMLGSPSRERVLVLGGGDGLAVREVLKYPDVESVTVVDIDPVITDLAKTHPLLVDLNEGSMKSSKVRVINEDAGMFIEKSSEMWNIIIIDLPDPRKPSLERLYSVEFYKACKKLLAKDGVIVTQATSPFFSPKAFWSIVRTIKEAGFEPIPIHTHVPTFGEWGWVIGARIPEDSFKLGIYKNWERFNLKTRFLDKDVLKTLFVFSPVNLLDRDRVEANYRAKPVLFDYYKQGLWELY